MSEADELRSEISRLRETNRKLHRRVQVAERFQAAITGQMGGLRDFLIGRHKGGCDMWASHVYRAIEHRLEISRAEVDALKPPSPSLEEADR